MLVPCVKYFWSSQSFSVMKVETIKKDVFWIGNVFLCLKSQKELKSIQWEVSSIFVGFWSFFSICKQIWMYTVIVYSHYLIIFHFKVIKNLSLFLKFWFHFSHCNYDPVWIQFIFRMATHLYEQYLLNSLTSPHWLTCLHYLILSHESVCNVEIKSLSWYRPYFGAILRRL